MLARRLASSLSGPGIRRLAEDPGGQFKESIDADHVHPMQFYIMPPLDERPIMSGDVYAGKIGGRSGHWVLVTPSCDLFQGKAEWLLMAACDLLSNQPEYVEWKEQQSNTKTKTLEDLLGNNRQSSQQNRYIYLPGALRIPDLVVDLQNVVALGRESFASLGLDRLATLDSPFSEALTSQFSRLFGRVGTPDLDTEWVMTRLRST